MDRLKPRDLRALLEVVRACYAPQDLNGWITQVLRALPSVVPADLTAYLEIDPVQRVVSASVLEPAHARFPGDVQRLEEHLTEHAGIAYLHATGDRSAVKMSDFHTQRQFHRLGLYNEFFRPLRVDDAMGVLLDAPSPLQITLVVARCRWDFSERERLLLNLLRPHLTQAYRNAELVAGLQQGLETSNRGMIVLTRGGRTKRMTPRANHWVQHYFGGPPREGELLPDPVQGWVRHQEAGLAGADDAPLPRTPLVVERDGARLVIRHLCDGAACYLVLEERQAALQPPSVEGLGLTRRESEVLQWVAQGKTNTEIGIILGIRAETVKKHLQSIFDTLGVETRTAAAAVALGSRSSA